MSSNPIDRREWLLGTGSLLASSLVPRALADSNGKAAVPSAPPAARVAIVKDTYFGETLSDPYRWMENDRDPDWLPFLKAQNAYARGVLDAIPGRDALARRIQQLSSSTAAIRRVQRAGGRLFIERRPAGADNFKLFVRVKDEEHVLIDPTALSGRAVSGHFSLDWWEASPDGLHVTYGLSPNGSEDSVLHILRVADGQNLPERIADTEGGHPRWLDDSTGFFYRQLTAAVGSPARYLDSRARFHRLHTDPRSDPILMQRGLVAEVVYERIQMPMILTFRGSQYALLNLVDVRTERRIFIAPVADVVANKARWIPVADFPDEVTAAAIDSDTLYLLANKGAPRGRILKSSVTAPSVSQATEIVPQGSLVIEDIDLARDGLYLTLMDGGIYRLRRLARTGQLTDVELPFDGTISTLAATPQEDGALLSLEGWLTAPDIWSVDARGHMSATGLIPKPPIDVSPYESQRLFARAKDGTRIPYSLLYRKGLRLDGATPAWISAYGSYGISAYTPKFAPKTLALIDAGCIVGYADVRGGGEYGREWHKAGQLTNKPNTWRDLIAVCEDLCARQYTSASRLAIGGRSAGGITVGRALTERPDLFAAVIDGVGWSNPLRYVAEQNGYGEEPEWGAISDPAGYRALKSIDSYQAVRDGTKYPAVLLTTGVTDPRVAPFHVAKMTARLQAASTSGKPILLRVDFDAGHGIGSTRAQQDREAVDSYLFLLWQTGVHGYQPG